MRKIVIIFAVLLMIAGCSKAVTEIDNNSNEITDIKSAIVYKLLEGTGTTVLRNEAVKNAYEGMRLVTNDLVSTDESSKTYLRIDDTKNILLDTGTKIAVTDYSKNSLKMELLEGAFFFDVTEKLHKDEEMSFKVANATMAIRGTSGAANLKDNTADLYIYTGEGFITALTDNNEEVSYSLYPLTKMEFEFNEDGEVIADSVSIEIVENEEIPELLQTYAHENEEYIEELKEDGWEDVTAEVILPGVFDPMNSDGDYLGWKQAEDGSWYFDKDNYDLNKDPEPYTEEETETEEPVSAKEEIKTEEKEEEKTVTVEIPDSSNNSDTGSDNKTDELPKDEAKTYPDKFKYEEVIERIYNGKTITVDIDAFDDETMTITGNTAKDAGEYIITVSPKEMWPDKTAEPIEIKWTINKALYKVQIPDRILYRNEIESFEFNEECLEITKPFADVTDVKLNYLVLDANEKPVLKPAVNEEYILRVEPETNNNYEFEMTDGLLITLDEEYDKTLKAPAGHMDGKRAVIEDIGDGHAVIILITTADIPDGSDIFQYILDCSFEIFEVYEKGETKEIYLVDMCDESDIFNVYAMSRDLLNDSHSSSIKLGTVIYDCYDLDEDGYCDKCNHNMCLGTNYINHYFDFESSYKCQKCGYEYICENEGHFLFEEDDRCAVCGILMSDICKDNDDNHCFDCDTGICLYCGYKWNCEEKKSHLSDTKGICNICGKNVCEEYGHSYYAGEYCFRCYKKWQCEEERFYHPDEDLDQICDVCGNIKYPDKSEIYLLQAGYEFKNTPYEIIPEGFNELTMVIEGDNIATNVGEYSFSVKPLDKWSDETTDQIDFIWNIYEAAYFIEIEDVVIKTNEISDFNFDESYITITEPFEGAPKIEFNYFILSDGIEINKDELIAGEYYLGISLSERMPSDFSKNFSFGYDYGTLTVEQYYLDDRNTIDD